MFRQLRCRRYPPLCYLPNDASYLNVCLAIQPLSSGDVSQWDDLWSLQSMGRKGRTVKRNWQLQKVKKSSTVKSIIVKFSLNRFIT